MQFVRADQRLFPLLALIAACSSDPAAPGPPPLLEQLPGPPPLLEQLPLDASSDFTFRLLRQINPTRPDSSLFVSPLSVTMALGMTLNGAAGATFEAMRSGLGLGTADLSEIDAAYAGIIGLFKGLDPSTQFEIANSIWALQGYPFRQTFLDATKHYFDAETQAVDFASPATLGMINSWVNRKTRGKITTILDQIDPADVMYLINAIYFKGSWRQRFDPAETRDGAFTTLAGTQETAKLMHRDASTAYARLADVEAAELLYGNGAFAMTVLLPSGGTSLNALVAGLTPGRWDSLTAQLRPAEVDLYLPKFRFEFERSLIPDLAALGMGIAFSDGADFSNLADPVPAGNPGLQITKVRHKAFVDVNEEGTEAAAVTSTGVGIVSLPQKVVFRVDRPFLFVLRERLSGAILFVGKMAQLAL